MYCLRASDGDSIWSFRTGGAVKTIPSVAAGDAVVFGSYDGLLYCLCAEDGREKWRTKVSERGGSILASPALAEGENCAVVATLDGVVAKV